MSNTNLALADERRPSKLAKQAVNVHKFGGSSLATAECIERVVNIIANHCHLHDVIVVSANGKTTDQLVKLTEQAIARSPEFLTTLNQLRQYQQSLIDTLLTRKTAEKLTVQLAQDFTQLTQWLNNAVASYQYHILAFGEVWSARLLAAVLTDRICPTQAIDARHFLRLTNVQFGDVNYSTSRRLYQQCIQPHHLTVVTGFIAEDEVGNCCVLGRNGSDYSATILAAITQARMVTFWTDVDGIYSADPRIVPQARKLHRLPIEVAQELGRLGNPVLHERTMKPLTEHQTHLQVASSFNAEQQGTEIGHFGLIAQQELSVTHLNDLLLVQSAAINNQNYAELAEQFHGYAGNAELGQLVISRLYQQALSQALASRHHQIRFTPVSLVAAVGYNIAKRSKKRATFNRAVAEYQPLVIYASDNQHALIAIFTDPASVEQVNHIHQRMIHGTKTIGLAIAGLGNISQQFLAQLPTQIERIKALHNVHLVALFNSSKCWFDLDGITTEQAVAQFEQRAQPYESEQLVEQLIQHPYDDLIVMDITASERFSEYYADFFQHGVHVISANKYAASSALPQYQQLLSLTKEHQCFWLNNTTVGAGLPINYAINDLLQSGDEINHISGIFSGSLSWIFAQFDGSQPFSSLVKQALTEGLTEPDPREDLSGRDVQRKLLILARLAGFELSLDDISCENLIPDSLQALSLDAFLTQLSAVDAVFEQRLHQAKQHNAQLAYVAELTVVNQKIQAKVSLTTIASKHPFASVSAGDNIFLIKSRWYQQNPLIIQGPGAGREVTAAGLHSDLVTLCQQLTVKQTQVSIKGIHS
jgi:aspartokinase/homoserine dehydrogenase 2